MATILRLQGVSTQLSNTPSSIGNARYLAIVHDHVGGSAHEVTLKTSGGSVIGSILVAPDEHIYISKSFTDTVEVEAAVTDIHATPVTITG